MVPQVFMLTLAFALVAIVGLLDYLTGYELTFSLFYTVPVGLATWTAGRRWGFLISIASAITLLWVDLKAGVPHSSLFFPYWNAAVGLGFFVIAALLVSEHKRARDERCLREQLEQHLQAVLKDMGLPPAPQPPTAG